MKVLVFGTFDHLHPGHLALFDQAAKHGDCLAVIVARDATVERIKGSLPDQNEEERLKAAKNSLPNAEVMLGDSRDYLSPVRAINPDVILLGYDQHLPPGVKTSDLPCPVERAEPYEQTRYKSSLLRENGGE